MTAAVRREGHFIEGGGGALHLVRFSPAGKANNSEQRAVLYLPPFAEEMNRSRRMAALMGQRLAAAGISFVNLDYFGTGDSAGDFAAARWEGWRDDALAALAWLRRRGTKRVTLLGLRLGACLALEAARGAPDTVERIVLWQPVDGGELHLNQFLRIRAAAGLSGGGQAETPRSLHARLEAGETIEVAGYPLSPGLAGDLDNLRLVDLAAECRAPVDWFEVVGGAQPSLPPARAKLVERLRAAGRDVWLETTSDPAFWLIEETTTAPNLLSATEARLAEAWS